MDCNLPVCLNGNIQRLKDTQRLLLVIQAKQRVFWDVLDWFYVEFQSPCLGPGTAGWEAYLHVRHVCFLTEWKAVSVGSYVNNYPFFFLPPSLSLPQTLLESALDYFWDIFETGWSVWYSWTYQWRLKARTSSRICSLAPILRKDKKYHKSSLEM